MLCLKVLTSDPLPKVRGFPSGLRLGFNRTVDSGHIETSILDNHWPAAPQTLQKVASRFNRAGAWRAARTANEK